MSLTVKYLGLALATLGLTIPKPVFAEAPMGAETAFTSGVALSGAPGSGELNCLDGERAVYNSQNSQYGYLQMSLTQSGQWKGDLKNSLGGDIANCDSTSPQQGKPICVLSTE